MTVTIRLSIVPEFIHHSNLKAIIKVNNASNNKRIKSINGLKAIMMLFIFYWHSPMKNPSADLGARMCEVLFVVSGFLVGYNYYDRPMPATFKQSWSYVSGKIARVWPIHLIAFLMMTVYMVRSDPQEFFSINTAYNAVVNICLLQAWSEDAFSFNGAAWFISALLFCYYISPLLLTILKKSTRVIASTLIGCIIIRIALELGSQYGANVFSFNYHVSPIIRCLEFFIGMLMVPAYFELRRTIDRIASSSNITHLKWITIVMTIIEFLVTAGYIFLIFRMEGKWIRGYFVLSACVLAFVYAVNKGMLSRILCLKAFSLVALIQMEFYILHQPVIRIFDSKVAMISQSTLIQTVILFFITLILSLIYSRYLKKGCTTAVARLLKKI